MKPVFADTVYYLALLNAHDSLNEAAARRIGEGLPRIVTTAWVLSEVLDALSRRTHRGRAIEFVDSHLRSPGLDFVRANDSLFELGLDRYRSRPDKDWSLTDCINFVVMELRSIKDALTADHHFEQAGFRILLK